MGKSNKSSYQKGRKRSIIANTRKNKAEKISLRHIHKYIDLKTQNPQQDFISTWFDLTKVPATNFEVRSNQSEFQSRKLRRARNEKNRVKRVKMGKHTLILVRIKIR